MKEWTILEILNWTKEYFTEKSIENPRLNAEMIIADTLSLQRLELYMKYDLTVPADKRASIKEAVNRRAQHEPLQYILGETEFYGYRFKVDRSVLIPRPETEYLVERMIKDCAAARSILEIGTGSGCIAITLARELTNAKIDAVDLYFEALETATKNCEENKADVNFIQSDIFSNIEKKYDVIVSNPPYISENEYRELSDEIRSFEPATALLAEEEGLYFFRRILEEAGNFLQENGRIYLEIGHDQAEAIKLIAEKNEFMNIEIIKDLNDFDRIMIVG